MKARIIKDGTFYIGQVYGTWTTYLIGVPVQERTGWKTVTSKCCTEFGAKRELHNWKREQSSKKIKEFEL